MGNNTSSFRGHALILSQDDFRDLKDEKRLINSLQARNFGVTILPNLNVESFNRVMYYNSKLLDYSAVDCLVVIVLACGDKNGSVTYSQEDQPILTKDIWQQFENCKSLNKTPKIFFIQTCQRFDELSSSREKNSALPCMPNNSEYFIASTSIKSKWQDQRVSFIETLCDLLDGPSTPGDLTCLLTTAANQCSDQTLKFVSFLQTDALPPRVGNEAVEVADSDSAAGTSKSITAVQPIDANSEKPAGHVLLLYTTAYATVAAKFEDSFKKMNYEITSRKFLAKLDKEIVKDARTISTKSHLIVLALAPICLLDSVTDNMQWALKLSKLKPFSYVWENFLPTTCPQLDGVPKIFLFIDPFDNTPKEKKIAQTETGACPLNLLELPDFLVALGFGNGFADNLLYRLPGGGDLMTMLTSTIRSSFNHGYHLPHFFCSLRSPVNLAAAPGVAQVAEPPSHSYFMEHYRLARSMSTLSSLSSATQQCRFKFQSTQAYCPPSTSQSSHQSFGSMYSESYRINHEYAPRIRNRELKVGVPYKIEELEWDDYSEWGPVLTGLIRVDEILRKMYFPVRVTKQDYPKSSLKKYSQKPSRFKLVISRHHHNTIDFDIVE